MARKRRIAPDAERTPVALTPAQQLAIQELMLKRIRQGERKPLLNDIIVNGLEELLRKEGWTEPNLVKIFPKQEVRRAKVESIRHARRRPSSA
jgi:hypothetical protein